MKILSQWLKSRKMQKVFDKINDLSHERIMELMRDQKFHNAIMQADKYNVVGSIMTMDMVAARELSRAVRTNLRVIASDPDDYPFIDLSKVL